MGTRQLRAALLVAASVVMLTACGESGSQRSGGSDGPSAGEPRAGGEATVLLGASFAGSWPTGLDPATNTTGGANVSLMNAIFGGLFQLTANELGGDVEIEGVLASGYEILDGGKSLVIRLRDGVVFSDGTPFDAEAVRFNIDRNSRSPCSCAPASWPWAEPRVSVLDERTVMLHFTRPFGAVISAFVTSNVNWIASPTALRKMGEDAFKIAPVGAGPFRVVSNQLSSRLVLERNPLYREAGRPYLDRLIFQSIGSDQAAYQALLAGDAHAYEGATVIGLVALAEREGKIKVTRQPETSPYVIQLNVSAPPFNDKRAREAIYYATDAGAIREGLLGERYPLSQMFTGPGGLFHHETVPGYRTYDLERARAIVAELGGLRTTLGTLRMPVTEQLITALQTQWREAGIDVTLEVHDIAGLVQEFETDHWQAMLQTAGAYDPEAGPGVRFRFSSERFSGVQDPELDRILRAAAENTDPQRRDALYQEAAKYISDNAYAPFLFGLGPAQFAVKEINGPGLTTKIPPVLVNTSVLWQDVWLAGE